MDKLETVRRKAMAFPEVEEATHFRLPAFKVRDKVFVVIQEDATHAIVHVDQEQAEAGIEAAPEACEAVWRNERIFVGLRVDLTELPEGHLGRLIEQAWHHRAPKRLAAAFEREA